MRMASKSKQPFVLQYLCLGLMILCAFWLGKRLIWGQYGLLRYQQQIAIQQKALQQHAQLLKKNKALQQHIKQLKTQPHFATSSIRLQLNRIRPNETFYLTD